MSSKKTRRPLSSNPSSTSSKRPRRFRWLWISLGLTTVASVSAVAGAVLAIALSSTPLLQSQLSPQDAEAFEQDDISTGINFRMPQLARPVNILVLGVKVLSSDVSNPPPEVEDLGYHALVNSLDGLSDTMLLLRFDPQQQEMTVLSLPRDTRTAVEGVGVTKLNEANYHGGPALAARSVSNLLDDVSIDRYVRINVQGVEKLVDALGGVSVYVPEDMKYQDDSQHLYINLKEGEQHLDGETAMQFLRFRYDQYGDIGRVQRQQMFMRALQEQALSPATLARLPKIFSVVQSHIDTNLSLEEMLALSGFASRMEREEVQMVMLPGDFSRPEQYELSYWLPQEDAINRMVAEYFSGGTNYASDVRSASNLRVAIQDTTGHPEAIDAMMTQLNDAGYWNVYVERDWGESLEETQIIAQGGDQDSANLIKSLLGLGEVRIDSTGVLQSDVTIHVGRDWINQSESALEASTQ
ncbi:MAG: LCP family protein [Elainellaceae cyanobacterium]